MKIIFNDTKKKSYTCIFRKVNDNVVYIIANKLPKNTSGFKAYTDDNIELGDYSNYKTIYRELEDGLQFSNNGTTEPDKTIRIYATFDYPNDTDTELPECVHVVTNLATYELPAPDYEYNLTVKEHVGVNITSFDNVAQFEGRIVDNYHIKYDYVGIDPIPSDRQRIIDLEAAVCELYELIGD